MKRRSSGSTGNRKHQERRDVGVQGRNLNEREHGTAQLEDGSLEFK